MKLASGLRWRVKLQTGGEMDQLVEVEANAPLPSSSILGGDRERKSLRKENTCTWTGMLARLENKKARRGKCEKCSSSQTVVNLM